MLTNIMIKSKSP